MKSVVTIIIGLALFLVGGGGGAVASQQGTGVGVKTDRDILASGPALTPMMAEIRAVLDSARQVEADLQLDLARTGTAEAADQIGALLEAHQLALKIKILEIQAHHVRAEGRQELAQLIEARLVSLRDNRPPIARAVATD